MKIFTEQFVTKQEQQLLDVGASPDEARDDGQRMREMLTTVTGYHHHKARIESDRDLSAEGKARRIAELRDKTNSQFSTFEVDASRRSSIAEQARLGAINGTLYETGAGFEVRHEPPKEPTIADHLIEREIRDRLHGKPSTEVYTMYREAIASGDHVFVRAVEKAPRSFRLLSDEQVKAADEAKLAASPYGKRVAVYESRAQVFAQAVAQAKRELD